MRSSYSETDSQLLLWGLPVTQPLCWNVMAGHGRRSAPWAYSLSQSCAPAGPDGSCIGSMFSENNSFPTCRQRGAAAIMRQVRHHVCVTDMCLTCVCICSCHILVSLDHRALRIFGQDQMSWTYVHCLRPAVKNLSRSPFLCQMQGEGMACRCFGIPVGASCRKHIGHKYILA